MRLTANIPNTKGFKTTLEKVNAFMPVTIIETAPFVTEFITFTKGQRVMLKVFPFLNQPYGYVIVAECNWPGEQARWLKHSDDKKQTVINRNDSGGFSLTISDVPTDSFFE